MAERLGARSKLSQGHQGLLLTSSQRELRAWGVRNGSEVNHRKMAPGSPTHHGKGTPCLVQAYAWTLGGSTVRGTWKSPSDSLGINSEHPGSLLMANPISPVSQP